MVERFYLFGGTWKLAGQQRHEATLTIWHWLWEGGWYIYCHGLWASDQEDVGVRWPGLEWQDCPRASGGQVEKDCKAPAVTCSASRNCIPQIVVFFLKKQHLKMINDDDDDEQKLFMHMHIHISWSVSAKLKASQATVILKGPSLVHCVKQTNRFYPSQSFHTWKNSNVYRTVCFYQAWVSMLD